MAFRAYKSHAHTLRVRREIFKRKDSTLSAPASANYQTESLEDLLIGVPIRTVTIPPPTALRNKYYGLRHGESEANVGGIISSDLTVGSSIHGLTPEGRAQARRAAVDLISKIGRESLLEPGKVIAVSSPFTRARETAVEAIETISRIFAYETEVYGTSSNGNGGNKGGVSKWQVTAPVDRCILLAECDISPEDFEFPGIPILIRESLRERYFGTLDAKELIFYNRVWPIDQIDAFNNRHGVESVQEVCARCASLVESLENEFQDKIIVFSSHADTLQIFQLWMSGQVDPRRFAEYRFRNGELRLLTNLDAPRVPMVYR